MNRDEAQRCIELGRASLRSGDFDKAMRLFEKSNRLFPSEEARAYIQVAMDRKAKGAEAPPPPEEKATAQKTDNGGQKATPEQERECERIMHIDSYYDILGVAKDSSQDDIKKAYRKLALRLHPDKNVAPGASEAFKRLNKAFTCLSDVEKRKKYDLSGTEEPSTPTYHSSQFEGDEWAEEVFRQFFGGGFGGGFGFDGRVYRRQAHPQHQEQRGRNNWHLLQLLPFLVLMLFSASSSFTYRDLPYSLQQQSKYQVLRYTAHHDIPYYVESTFLKDYSLQEVREIEDQVESQYAYNLRVTCQRQTTKKNNLMYQAQWSYSKSTANQYKELAKNVDMGACRQLDELYRA